MRNLGISAPEKFIKMALRMPAVYRNRLGISDRALGERKKSFVLLDVNKITPVRSNNIFRAAKRVDIARHPADKRHVVRVNNIRLKIMHRLDCGVQKSLIHIRNLAVRKFGIPLCSREFRIPHKNRDLRNSHVVLLYFIFQKTPLLGRDNPYFVIHPHKFLYRMTNPRRGPVSPQRKVVKNKNLHKKTSMLERCFEHRGLTSYVNKKTKKRTKQRHFLSTR